MKTLRYKKVDGYLIFDKFDVLPVDPVMTQISNKSALLELPEQTDVDRKIAEKLAHSRKRQEVLKKARSAKKIIDDGGEIIKSMKDGAEKNSVLIAVKQAPAVFAEESRKLRSYESRLIICDEELNDLNSRLMAKRKEIIKANAIFSHPRKDEVALTDEEFLNLKTMLDSLENSKISLSINWEEKVVLSESGKKPVTAPFPKLSGFEKIADFRGEQYFWKVGEKWESSAKIEELGVLKKAVVPSKYLNSAIEKKSLSREEREEIRIQNLSSSEKESEKESALTNALRRAAMMKIELEIKGDADALDKSRNWYQNESSNIDNKYAMAE